MNLQIVASMALVVLGASHDVISEETSRRLVELPKHLEGAFRAAATDGGAHRDADDEAEGGKPGGDTMSIERDPARKPAKGLRNAKWEESKFGKDSTSSMDSTSSKGSKSAKKVPRSTDATIVQTPNNYCRRTSSPACWPSAEVWQSDLGAKLSPGATLDRIDVWDFAKQESFDRCDNSTIEMIDRVSSGLSPLPLSEQAEPPCLYKGHCLFKGCQFRSDDVDDPALTRNLSAAGPTAEDPRWDLPAYAVAVRTVDDVIRSVEFANAHDLQVTVRLHGHSYTGSSTGRDSLLIWLAGLERPSKPEGEPQLGWTDSCGTEHPASLVVGGGQTWQEAYRASGPDWDLLGGFCPTVGAVGGWLQGGGYSNRMGRAHGLGVDNVLEFRVVLPNAKLVTVDACSHPHLFWALRGGGGGSWGVVVAARYRLHTAEPVTAATIQVNITAPGMRREWARFLAPTAATLDNRWTGSMMRPSDGFWAPYFKGTREEADQSTFLKELRHWSASLDDHAKLRGGDPGHEGIDLVIELYELESYSQLIELTEWPSFIWAPSFWMQGRATPSNWLVPWQWMLDHPEEAAALLDDDRIHGDSYLIGGAISEVGGDETAVNPAIREAGWILCTEDEEFGEELREMFPESGADYNHASATLEGAKFGERFWGAHYDKLLRIKNQVDPQHRFACNNCVGWGTRRPEVPISPTSSSTNTGENKESSAKDGRAKSKHYDLGGKWKSADLFEMARDI